MADGGGNSGNFYKAGDWLAICDICGFRYKASRLKRNWKGEMVCEQDFELRHPQEFVRVRPEKIGVPWARPEGQDLFVAVCWVYQIVAYAGLGVSGCMQAGNQNITGVLAYSMKYQRPDVLAPEAAASGIPGYAIPGYAIPNVTFTGYDG